MELMTGRELSESTPREREFAVNNLVPLGSVAVIAAKKGRGKSVFALTMADAVSRGDAFLNRATNPGQVLYVGTEDDEIELQERYKKLLASRGLEPSDDLDITDHWATVDEGGLEEIYRWCDGCPDPRAVIIDLIVHVNPDLLKTSRGFSGAAASMTAWIKLAREKNIAVILVAHMWRGAETPGADPIDRIQGSGGFTAYAQTIIALMGNPTTTDRLLYFQGKFGSGQLPVTIDGRKMTCSLRETEPESPVEVSEAQELVLRLVKNNPGRQARVLARMLPGRSLASTTQLLWRMGNNRQLVIIDRRYFHPDDPAVAQAIHGVA